MENVEAPTCKQNRLSRAGIDISGDLPVNVTEEILYATFEVDGRFLDDRIRPYTLTIGFIETLANIEHVNALAQRDIIPENIVFTTIDQDGDIVSIREFANLKFRTASVSYAQYASHERPVHKVMYDATLVDAQYHPNCEAEGSQA